MCEVKTDGAQTISLSHNLSDYNTIIVALGNHNNIYGDNGTLFNPVIMPVDVFKNLTTYGVACDFTAYNVGDFLFVAAYDSDTTVRVIAMLGNYAYLICGEIYGVK